MSFLDNRSELLENAYAALSANYKGKDVDLYEVCKKQRQSEPVIEGDFMKSLEVATHADVRHTFPVYAVFKYNDIRKVLMDSETFTSGFIRAGLGQFFGGDGLIILAMDGEEHKETRALLKPIFMPANVRGYTDLITEIVREEFIKPVLPLRKFNLMDFGLYFPIRVIYELIGFPKDMLDEIYEVAAMGLAILSGQQLDEDKMAEALSRSVEAADNMRARLVELSKRRRAEGDFGKDLISQLILAEHKGQRLTDHEVGTFAGSLLPASGETTTRTFSCLMSILLKNPELWERLKADRSLIPKAINEATRYEGVATVKVRQASKDTEIGGVKIPKGALVQCLVASANRDEDVFENPDQYDIDRKAAVNFTFGFGPHMCIGQFIAKMELEAALNVLMDLMPNLRLDPDYPEPEIKGAQLRGVSDIYVRWD
ncbi:cytochrome P450 [Litorimonas sp.]|uniref:cytochrome P450 n=1 Tax=Litorimonas sp. TaxID=1892381 RepID=UPI003A880C77